VGSHAFQVRATDPAGNTDATPASFTWSITSTEVTACPESNTIFLGTLRTANQVCSDNNTYYEVNSTTSSTRAIGWYGTFTGVTKNLISLKVTYSGKNSQSCSQTIGIWRWTDNTLVTLDQRNVGTTEVLIADLVPAGNLSDYVSGSGATGTLAIVLICTNTSTSFYSSTDLLKIVYSNVDTTPPNTTITASPAASSNSATASFSFSSTETGSTFGCKLDAGSFATCTTPKSYTGLTVGSHTFQVRATDAAGNTDSTPASFTWTIKCGNNNQGGNNDDQCGNNNQ
jgi:hypothetical protein